ncbi:Hypothetical predicted protein [Mytilus galloprovincialis]|uniref:Apple domain-containing protein n=1 Tax=Mytilus galloprovincialis TaxID=29158 RepID=A0A8B6FJ99_MYTGA|nr:Hypothetical predicted protein [Mytilus galloprovincialis]
MQFRKRFFPKTFIIFISIPLIYTDDECLNRPDSDFRQCTSHRLNPYNDKTEQERKLWTKTYVSNVLRCSSYCMNDQRCVTYFFNKSTKTCTGHSIMFGNATAASVETGNVLYYFSGGEKWLIQESNRTREYYKPTSQLNSKEKKARRERIRDNVSAYRKRQITLLNKTNNVALLNEADLDEPNPVVLIADENGVSSTSTNQPLIVKMPLISAKSKGGKKRASHALKRATNEIRNLKTHNKNLKKSQNTLRKRLEREKKRNSEKKNTPRSKTDALIQRAGLTPGARNTENIRKKLLYAECVSKEIRETSEENPTKRKLVGIVVSGKFMKKYKMLTELKKSTNITWRTQAQRSKKLNHERQPRNMFLRQKIASDVEQFLCRDDNSRCMPGKADAVKYGKVKKQKRILNDYLHNILIKFCAEHTYRISLATLARYRPKYICLVNYASRNTCLCQKHQDFALKLRCMKQMGGTTCTSPDQYVTMHRDNGIQEDLEKITLEKVNYKQWKKVKIIDGKERMKIVDIELGKDDFKVEMVHVPC